MAALQFAQLPCAGIGPRKASVRFRPCSRPTLCCHPAKAGLDNDPIHNPDFDDVKLDEEYYRRLGIDAEEREAQKSWEATDIDPEGYDLTLDNLFDDNPQASDLLDALPKEKAYGPKAMLLAGLQPEEVATTRALMDAVGAHDVKVVACTQEMLFGSLDAALAVPEPQWELPRSGSASQGAGWGAQRVCMFAGLSLKAVATAVELMEETGLPPLCAAFAMAEDARRPLGELLAEAVKDQRGRKNPEKDLWETAQRASDTLPDVQKLIHEATKDRLDEMDEAAAEGRLEEFLAEGAVDMTPEEIVELERRLQQQQQNGQQHGEQSAAQSATADAQGMAQHESAPQPAQSASVHAPVPSATIELKPPQPRPNAADQAEVPAHHEAAAQQVAGAVSAAAPPAQKTAEAPQSQPPQQDVVDALEQSDVTPQNGPLVGDHHHHQQQEADALQQSDVAVQGAAAAAAAAGEQQEPAAEIEAAAAQEDDTAGEVARNSGDSSAQNVRPWKPEAQPVEQRRKLLQSWRFAPGATAAASPATAAPAASGSQQAPPSLPQTESSAAAPSAPAAASSSAPIQGKAARRRLYQQPAGPQMPAPPVQEPSLAELQAAAVAARQAQHDAQQASQASDDELFWAKLMLVNLEMQQEARTQRAALEQPGWEAPLDWQSQLAQLQSSSEDGPREAELVPPAATTAATTAAAPRDYHEVAASEFNIIDLIADDPSIDPTTSGSSAGSSSSVGSSAPGGGGSGGSSGGSNQAIDSSSVSATAADAQEQNIDGLADEQQDPMPTADRNRTQLSSETIQLIKEAGGDPEQLRRMLDEAAAEAAARQSTAEQPAASAEDAAARPENAQQQQQQQQQQHHTQPRPQTQRCQEQPLAPQPSPPRPPAAVPWATSGGPTARARLRPAIKRQSAAPPPSTTRGFARRRPAKRTSRVTPMTLDEMQALAETKGKTADGWMMKQELEDGTDDITNK